MRSETWRERAACRRQPTDLFFVKEYKREVINDLKEMCGHCPVKVECLSFADEMEGSSYKDTWGIYGGLTSSERIARRAAKQRPTPPCNRALGRAYNRHLKRGEAPCAPCREWKARRDAEQIRWDHAKEMLRQGCGVKETCLTLGVNHHTLKRLRQEMQTDSIQA